MYEGKQFDNWNHTAAQMALLANVNRGKRGRAFEVADFHPLMTRRSGVRLNKQTISALKMFVPKENLAKG
tara:strand:- start:277 stop:486 length:210 start_codon:yes stop_codon:yes gene_type:complete